MILQKRQSAAMRRPLPPLAVYGSRDEKPGSGEFELGAVRSEQSTFARRVVEAQVPGVAEVYRLQRIYNGIVYVTDEAGLARLRAVPGARAVHILTPQVPDNAVGVPFIGVPQLWANPGLPIHGEGIRVGIIDTGIDYTHADFGGPGTAAAYAAAHANEAAPADPALFGPAAPKVKGGIDLVGDAYDASAPAGSPKLVPHPDPNPLDCNGHGSHVSGTAAGFGVLSTGATYTGGYDANTIACATDSSCIDSRTSGFAMRRRARSGTTRSSMARCLGAGNIALKERSTSGFIAAS